MATKKRDNLFMLIGIVGKDPEVFETSAGDVMKFSVATTLKYPSERGADDGETRWVQVAVWKEELQELVAESIEKGSKVAVIGFLKSDREYKGEKQYDLTATQIGLVEFLVPTKKAAKKSSTKVSTKKASNEDEDEEDEGEW